MVAARRRRRSPSAARSRDRRRPQLKPFPGPRTGPRSPGCLIERSSNYRRCRSTEAVGARSGAGFACRPMIAPSGSSDRWAGTYGGPAGRGPAQGRLPRSLPEKAHSISSLMIFKLPLYHADGRVHGKGAPSTPVNGWSQARHSRRRVRVDLRARTPEKHRPGRRPAVSTPPEAVPDDETVIAPPAAGGALRRVASELLQVEVARARGVDRAGRDRSRLGGHDGEVIPSSGAAATRRPCPPAPASPRR